MQGTDTKLNVVLTAQDDASAAIQSAANNINSSLGGVQNKAKDTGKSLEDMGTSMLKGGAVIAGAGAGIIAVLDGIVSPAVEASEKTNVYQTMLKNLADTSTTTSKTIKSTGTELKNTGDAATAIHDKIAALNITIADDEAKMTATGKAHKLTSTQVADLQQKISTAKDEISKYNTELATTKTTHDKTTEAITKTYGASQSLDQQITSAATAMEKYGANLQDSQLGILTLYKATGDMTTAQKDANLALDLSTYENATGHAMTYADALKKVEAIANGQVKSLADLGITAASTGKDGTVAMNDLATAVGGVGHNQEDIAVKMAAANEQFDQFKILLGTQLLPVLGDLLTNYIIPLIDKVKDWVTQHQEATKVILIVIGVVGTLAVVLGGAVVAIGAVVAGIGTIVAGGVPLLVAIAAVVAAVVGFIATILLLNTNWGQVWSDIKDVAKAAWDWINSNVIKPMTNALQALINMVANSPLGKAASAIGGGISSAVGFIAGHLATGGNVSAGSTYMVGENGPEMFVAGMSGSIVPNSQIGGGGVGAITVNINGGMITDDVAKNIGNIIIQQFKRTSRW